MPVRNRFDTDQEFATALRDYFAAKELAAFQDKNLCDEASVYARYADHCYRMADAMLIARETSHGG